MLGEYVEYEHDFYRVVMVGNNCLGLVTLRSRSCSVGLVVVVEQECVSFVTGPGREWLTLLYDYPDAIHEYIVGNILKPR